MGAVSGRSGFGLDKRGSQGRPAAASYRPQSPCLIRPTVSDKAIKVSDESGANLVLAVEMLIESGTRDIRPISNLRKRGSAQCASAPDHSRQERWSLLEFSREILRVAAG